MALAKKNLSLVGLLIAPVVLVAAGCGGSGGSKRPEALPPSSCTPIEYGGGGQPDYLIVSDMPLRGASRIQTLQVDDGVRSELRQAGFKAGRYGIGFQACDDSTARSRAWDPAKCRQNAEAYAGNDKVVGIIGTFDSGCAAIILPVVNQAPRGGIAMVSPANTYVCLTQGGPGCDRTEPARYYPSGTRNYVRVVANDGYQGAADAEFARSIGVKKVFVLDDNEAYGVGVATNFERAAKSLGIQIAGVGAFDPEVPSYEALYEKIKATGADGVFIGGILGGNGGRLIKAKVAVLGPNAGVKLIASDGFATQQTISDAGRASRGMYMSVAGEPIDRFQGAARVFATTFSKQYLNGQTVDPSAIYGGEAATVLLDAIGASNGSRRDVIKKLFATRIQNGLLGSFSFDANGDPVGASGAVVAVTVYKGVSKLEIAKVISPKQATIDAALGRPAG